jgi:hypothetical protein
VAPNGVALLPINRGDSDDDGSAEANDGDAHRDPTGLDTEDACAPGDSADVMMADSLMASAGERDDERDDENEGEAWMGPMDTAGSLYSFHSEIDDSWRREIWWAPYTALRALNSWMGVDAVQTLGLVIYHSAPEQARPSCGTFLEARFVVNGLVDADAGISAEEIHWGSTIDEDCPSCNVAGYLMDMVGYALRNDPPCHLGAVACPRRAQHQ